MKNEHDLKIFASWNLRLGRTLEIMYYNPLLKAVTCSRLPRITLNEVLIFSKDRDSPTSEQPFPVLNHSQTKSLLMFKCKFLDFSLCPLPLILRLGKAEKMLVPSLLPPTGYSYTLSRPSRLRSPSCLPLLMRHDAPSPS